VHADKEPEPLNLGVPVVDFPRANAILARAQALLWVRDWGFPLSVTRHTVIGLKLVKCVLARVLGVIQGRIQDFSYVSQSFRMYNLVLRAANARGT
jgi:hypothetical protein